MTQDHNNLDAKTICNCIMSLVKDMPTILMPIFIANMQARFQYRVSYRKAGWSQFMHQPTIDHRNVVKRLL
ncbi:putative inactive leucine-rich repeat receptor-like protein kinase [Gossypium australe]|uniref:Putative inactive leucine-rich repeat receptor-like protein kinase n=1 Tax=Gossypium australe TaxID=47621 RepID=A0A5B6U3E4_9ROSI|nr:putative inactive leucine-rich repeat receptor-like protein kinase [Gossypium australe]